MVKDGARMASRRDYHQLVRLRAEWLDAFISADASRSSEGNLMDKHVVRMARRRDYHQLVRLRAEWLDTDGGPDIMRVSGQDGPDRN